MRVAICVMCIVNLISYSIVMPCHWRVASGLAVKSAVGASRGLERSSGLNNLQLGQSVIRQQQF